VPQESFGLPAVLANRFGRHVADAAGKNVSARLVVEGRAGRQRLL